MGIFDRSRRRQELQHLHSLVADAMEADPLSGPEGNAAFGAACETLRAEGASAADYMLALADEGVRFPYTDRLWAAIYEMGDSVVPGVKRVLSTSGNLSARMNAALTLATFAEYSPAVRDECIATLRDAAANAEPFYVQQAASGGLDLLRRHGVI